ncbi:peptidase associated/transthyretin-like domain-containing protein [Chitinophaga arvensicola]|uniref:CarboxypepD_reg-like domain-containing protein n=1 Tax=Chitinophaga arvensicola TaxID=29529 RepID=A0A1I0S8W7_9BACT|nr:hypothetical protein [Chitinophaga arvensicola]SEW52583.1 hypothetical protein SAMN04488122_4952 [Chitinophaga arvensicola]
MKATYTSIIFLLIPGAVFAQKTVSGRITDATSFLPLEGVSGINISTRKTVITDSNGAFIIGSHAGDTLRFSRIGYLPQQVIISRELFNLPTLSIKMTQGVITLQQQLVRGHNHSADSMRLRDEYGKYFKKPQQWDFNLLLPKENKAELRDQFHTVRQSVNINQLYKNLSFRRNKRLNNFRKTLLAKEEAAYCDHAYDPDIVQQVTGLHGDSLDYFMAHYQPSTAILQTSTRYELMICINRLYLQYKDSIAMLGKN